MKGSTGPETTTWYIQRRDPESGRLVPCTMVLQKGTGVVVSEVCTKDTQAGGAVGVMATIEKLGIQANLQMGPDGAVVNILSGNIPESTQHELDFFQLDRPCRFPGCEALREQYQKDVAALPPGCSMCEYGSVMRKYIAIMEKMRV